MQTCGDNARRKNAALARRWTGQFAQSFSLDFDKVALIVSPSTDQFLACAHAFGAAVNSETVLLSSSLAAVPEYLRARIVGHELAHTAQLARGGSDTDDQLEAEAWQAALSANADRCSQKKKDQKENEELSPVVDKPAPYDEAVEGC